MAGGQDKIQVDRASYARLQKEAARFRYLRKIAYRENLDFARPGDDQYRHWLAVYSKSADFGIAVDRAIAAEKAK